MNPRRFQNAAASASTALTTSASSDQACGRDAAPECMLEQAGADPLADPILVGRELSQQEAGNGVRRLTGSYRPRQGRGNDGRRCKAIMTDHPVHLVHHHDGGKTLFLVGQRSRFQPAVERWLAAGELVELVRWRQR
ncbi:hypothetical protein XH99_21965 [Bradyrhizobium nanningense]|uniref:Uncharacterized protein n=1 Tax=Bradyrhizobium nanningense TaxID=1325118 RepID=A0A4Q0S114_9BRAD|nr:hypothetical protein XH99_21965 [Bradyrhizobium nanningense]RXH29904.1 hypothetical protein XH84_20210 [Bradyrhizobium nanningense]